jgi:hypothetical protein
MSGIVQGGWEYVIAAYGLTVLLVGAYTASLALRLRAERCRARAALDEEATS